MAQAHEKAIVINKFWASVYATVIAAALLGGVAYAWQANAQIAVLQRDVNELNNANTNTRLARMEEQLKNVNDKLDMLRQTILQQRGYK